MTISEEEIRQAHGMFCDEFVPWDELGRGEKTATIEFAREIELRAKEAKSGELKRRYVLVMKLLRRVVAADYRPHWKEGETIDEVLSEIREWIMIERLEKEIIEDESVPAGEDTGGD